MDSTAISNILEELSTESVKKFSFFERAVQLPSGNVNIFGPARCGKSMLAQKWLNEHKKDGVLSLDFDDLRLFGTDISKLQTELEEFVKKQKIGFLLLENPPDDFVAPKEPQTVMTSRKKSLRDGYTNLPLSPLCFEEYLSFQSRHHFKKNSEVEDADEHIKTLFGLFAKDGALPEMTFLSEAAKLKRAQEVVKNIGGSGAKLELFCFYLQNISNKLSFYQAYTALKERAKISKDTLYAYSNELFSEGHIFFIEKLGQTGGAKKIYAYDFALKNAVSFKKNFLKSFENMIFSEVYLWGSEIFYADEFELCVPELKRAVTVGAFLDEDGIKAKVAKALAKKPSFDMERLDIVTLGVECSFEIGGVLCEAEPFWSWALKGGE